MEWLAKKLKFPIWQQNTCLCQLLCLSICKITTYAIKGKKCYLSKNIQIENARNSL